ncbi:MAG: GHMP family kinase ATP-binding protein [Promethearchaeota archaeon]
MKKMVISRAPVRICDIGGWTDTWFYPNGAVFNICVDLYSYVRIVESNNDKVRIFAENIKEYVEIKNHSEIEYNGNLDLLKAAIKRIKILGGMDIFIRAEAPPACGTGTSASVAVALVSALARWQEIEMNPLEVAKLAHLLEIEELKLESGVQDQYAAASGGINFMEVNYPDVKLHKIQVSKKRILELENQLILVYLSSRSSSKMHQAVIRNFKNKDNLTMENFDIMKECAYEMKSAINSNIEKVGEIINRNWEAQKKLHPKMTNSYIDKLEKISKEHGALGFKCNGAGGGGSAVILSSVDNVFALREEIIKNGYQILPCKLSFNGVESFNL